MSWFYHAAKALKEQGNAWNARLNIFGIVATLALFIIFQNFTLLFGTLLFAVLLSWDIDESFHKEKRAELARQLADKDDETVFLKGEIVRLEDQLAIYKTLKENKQDNPIKSNRIVSDKTFALRLRMFVGNVRCSDPMSEEEADYLLRVAERLLKWQTKTVRKDSSEYAYLQMHGLMPEPSKNTEEHTEEEKPSVKPQAPKAKPVRKPKAKQTEGTDENKD